MKYDIIIQNPPYNPNALWKRFVTKGIDELSEDGLMLVIHPDSWRWSTRHKKLFDHIKVHISELHIMDYSAFPGVAISTDWYLYHKNNRENEL
jgi:predicted methyltransferase